MKRYISRRRSERGASVVESTMCLGLVLFLSLVGLETIGQNADLKFGTAAFYLGGGSVTTIIKGDLNPECPHPFGCKPTGGPIFGIIGK